MGPAAPWSTFLGWDQDSDQDQSLCRVSPNPVTRSTCVDRFRVGTGGGALSCPLSQMTDLLFSVLGSRRRLSGYGLRHTAAGAAAHRRFTLTPRLIAASMTSKYFFDWTMFRQLGLQNPSSVGQFPSRPQSDRQSGVHRPLPFWR